jgi:hypothetical protein
MDGYTSSVRIGINLHSAARRASGRWTGAAVAVAVSRPDLASL